MIRVFWREKSYDVLERLLYDTFDNKSIICHIKKTYPKEKSVTRVSC